MPHEPASPADRPDAYAPLIAPRGVFLSGEESLRVTSFNAVASARLRIEARSLNREGHLVTSGDDHVPNTDRSSASTLIPLGAGWLLDFIVRASVSSPRVGQCWVLVELVRGFSGAVVPVAVLAKGYVTDTSRLSGPGLQLRESTEGPGAIRSITGTNPAAGAEFSEAVPTNARWRLLSVSVVLVTSATVANREVALVLDDGANIYARLPSRSAQTASDTVRYTFALNGALEALSQDNSRVVRLPPIVMADAHRLRSITTNLQVGDDFGAPQLLVEEWIED